MTYKNEAGENVTITDRQERALSRIRLAALDRVGTLRTAEIKRENVTVFSQGTVFVAIEAGYTEDEGTLLASLGRVRGCFTVGLRGSIVSVEKKSDRYRRFPLIYGWQS